MPTYSIGMTDHCHGPIEDSAWLGIAKVRVPSAKDLACRLIEVVLEDVDVGFAEA